MKRKLAGFIRCRVYPFHDLNLRQLRSHNPFPLTMEEIGQTLQGSLSSDANTRMAAELKLAKAFGQPGQHRAHCCRRRAHTPRVAETGLALASLAVAQQADPTLRQVLTTRAYIPLRPLKGATDRRRRSSQIRDRALVPVLSAISRLSSVGRGSCSRVRARCG